MTETRWRLDDPSIPGIPVGAYAHTASNTGYSLNNISGGTISRTTSSPSPYEGTGCYQGSQNATDNNLWSVTKLNGSVYQDLAGQSCYIDLFLYFGGSSKYITPFTTGNDTTQEYTWVSLNSEFGTVGIYTYGTFDSPQSQTRAVSSTGIVPANQWTRVVISIGSKGPTQCNFFKGTNILGYIPDATVSWTGSTYSNYQWLYGGAGNSGTYFDDIILNDVSSPNRGGSTSTYKLGYGISRY